MQRLILKISLLGVLIVPWTLAADDEAGVRELVRRYLDARNQRDEAATRALFTPDADQLVSTGEWRRGIDALVKGAMASSQRESGKSVITLDAVRFLEPNVAIADGAYETSTIGAATTRKMRTTFVVKHTAEGWRIAAIRNMLPAPPAH